MNNLKNNNFRVLIIALIAFFILIFFTKNFYVQMQENILENDNKKEQIKILDSKLDNLNKLKIDLNSKDTEITKKLKKFIGDFSEDKIFLYLNDYIEQINESSGSIALFLNNISFSEPSKTELGFRKIDINLNMKVENKYFLENLLDYLTSSENQYGFFITDFSFPIEKTGPYEINIPLKMYIK